MNRLFDLESSTGSGGELLSNERSREVVSGGVRGSSLAVDDVDGRFLRIRLRFNGDKPMPLKPLRIFSFNMAFLYTRENNSIYSTRDMRYELS